MLTVTLDAMHLTPRMDPLEPRRLFSFVAGGASTVNGQFFQSIDQTVQLPDGSGYVSAGIFAEDSDLGTGSLSQPLGRSDVFLSLVKKGKASVVSIGGESRQKLQFDHDRVDFEADPRRGNEDFNFGIDSRARGADEYVKDMAFGPDGKLYVALIFRRPTSLNTANPKAPTLTPDSQTEGDYVDSAVLRYNVSGKRLALEKTMQIGGPFNDVVNSIGFDASGNLYLGGRSERLADFDPSSGTDIVSPDNNGRSAGFVAKYTSDFKLQYVSKFGGDSSDEDKMDAVFSIAVAADGTVVAGGSFARTADFDPRSGKSHRTRIEAEGDTDAFTLKLKANGTLAWVKTQGGDGYDAIQRVTLAPDGGVYSAGYYEDKADLDASPDARREFRVNDDDNEPTDLFFNRFDADGNQLFVKPISGDGIELLASATTDSSGDLVLAGSFYGHADFDPSKNRKILSTPSASIDDSNDNGRDNAYAGFVAVYSSVGKLRRSTQINGPEEQDVFITGATLNAADQLSVAGRYRGSFSVPGTSLAVRTLADPGDTNEDGYTLVFDSDLKPIV